MRVLVLNAGSSSIKYAVFDERLAEVSAGRLERVADHRKGFHDVLRSAGKVDLVGHRVVHGGARFSAPARVDAEVLAAIRATAHLAPVHTPINLAGIEAVEEAQPGAAQVAVFDTAFHHTMPEHAWRYAVPRDQPVRRYGFHGISVQYVTRKACELLGRADANLVVLHLGNGASATAVKAGRSVDTSMGMTPVEGLVMGTRSGDVDPAIAVMLGEEVLNRDSGLRGLCGDSDMRAVLARSDPDAQLALQIYCYRIRKYIGAYFAVLGRVDAVVFTGGVGEHSEEVRRRACEGLPFKVLVVPTDEEHEIARQALECIR